MILDRQGNAEWYQSKASMTRALLSVAVGILILLYAEPKKTQLMEVY